MQQKHEDSPAQADTNTTRSITPLQRLLQRTDQIDAAKSLGEALLPFLLAVVETCWFSGILIGLAGVNFLHSRTALLPFWGPPLLLCAALWLFQRALLREAREPEQSTDARTPAGFGMLFSVLALLDLGLIWLSIYAGTNFLLDPRWLLSFISDLLSLNDHFYQVLAIVIITVYFCWRGTRLAQLNIEPAHVWRQMWVGMLVLLVSVLLRAGQSKPGGGIDDIALVLLIPAFLYFALSAHALARIAFVRRSHPFGLEGSIAAQERAMLSVIGGLGLLLLLLTLIGGGLFSAAFFNSLQPVWQAIATAYGWLVHGLSLVLAWISQPILWLILWIFSLLPHRTTVAPPVTPSTIKKFSPLVPVVQTNPGVLLASKIILPLLLLLGLSILVLIALRRRKRIRITRNRASGDVHESVWSWALFWGQFKAFWAKLFRRNGARDTVGEDGQSIDGLPAEPAARTIREIYRALLKKAAFIGYTRGSHETPYEFQQRLNQSQKFHNEPQLGQLTEVYALTRYSGSVPDEYDLTNARQSWDALEKKWEAQP